MVILALMAVCFSTKPASAQVGGFSAGATTVADGSYRLIGVVGAAVPTSGQVLIQRKQFNRQELRLSGGSLGEVPEVFSLRANYPNPLRTTTTLRFGLPEDTHVRLTVYDLLGRAVGTVVDKVEPAGIHLKVFDASRLPSGLYLYRLEAGDFSQVRTMMVVR